MKRLEYELPLYIQEEIMKKLPVKSLVQFRSVSKSWKSLIDSSEFIALHCHTQQQHLLVSFECILDEIIYERMIDDDTFPQQSSYLTPPLSAKQITNADVVGSSQGLVCLYESHPHLTTKVAVLLNPSIRKSIAIDVPGQPYIGFGVCPSTSDPKIVSIKQSPGEPGIETSYHCEVMVYSLSTRKWKTPSNPPAKPLRDLWRMIAIKGFIYWHAGLLTHKMIMSFDVTNENFELIDLPNSLACNNTGVLCMSQLRDSLAMIDYTENICIVWRMERGVKRSFTKLFTIETPHKIAGFRKSGVPIMHITSRYDDDEEDDEYNYHCKLVVYEPNSEQNIDVQTTAPPFRFCLSSYIETLLLLGRFDCISY